MALQPWFIPAATTIKDGDRRGSLPNTFDALQNKIAGAFQGNRDYMDTSIAAAAYGISGAVDNYGDLPDPSTLREKTIYIVRNAAGAPSGNGLYWVQTGAWAFLDALNEQDASEVPYDNTTSGLVATDVQAAIDEEEGLRDGVATALTTLTGQLISPAVLYTDCKRTDTYTADGTIARPYKTIMEAINKIIANADNVFNPGSADHKPYVVMIKPGRYVEDIVLENAALHGVSLIAEGGSFANTVIVGQLRSAANNDTLSELTVKGLNINPTAAGMHAVHLEGASDGTSFCGYDCSFEDCILTPGAGGDALHVVNCVSASVYDTTVNGNASYQNSYASVVGMDSQVGGNVTVAWDGAANKPAGYAGWNGCYVMYMNSVIVGTTTTSRVNEADPNYRGNLQLRLGNRLTGTVTNGNGCQVILFGDGTTLRGTPPIQNNSVDADIVITGAYYKNTTSGLTAVRIQDAIDEVYAKRANVPAGVTRPGTPVQGQMFFDTNLATPIPIWWDGTQWIDSAGTPV